MNQERAQEWARLTVEVLRDITGGDATSEVMALFRHLQRQVNVTWPSERDVRLSELAGLLVIAASDEPRCVCCNASGVPLDSEYGECADCRRNRLQRNGCPACGADLSREGHARECENSED